MTPSLQQAHSRSQQTLGGMIADHLLGLSPSTQTTVSRNTVDLATAGASLVFPKGIGRDSHSLGAKVLDFASHYASNIIEQAKKEALEREQEDLRKKVEEERAKTTKERDEALAKENEERRKRFVAGHDVSVKMA